MKSRTNCPEKARKTKMTRNELKRKLTSRKLWVALAGMVTNIIIAVGGSASTAAQVTAIIMAGAAVVAYIVGEGLVDAAKGGDTK